MKETTPLPKDQKALGAREVETSSVRCDGGAGPLGHPAIYLSLEKTGEVVCPYCSRAFINKSLQKKVS